MTDHNLGEVTTMRRLSAVMVMVAGLLLFGPLSAAEKTWRDSRGRIRFRPAPADPNLNNPWPAEWEDAFAQRVDHALNYWSQQKLSCNTWGENEKSGYPKMMWAFLLGDQERAIAAFETPDVQQDDHRHTLGVDFYWCFTLKGQMRKYFYFGDALSPDYRARFEKAAAIWTERDPYRRPHPVYGTGGKGTGWGPDAKGSWVDVRRTDNLRAMCDTSVYLMAELSGNEETRRLYKERILAYVRMLYHTGMMEWDSENYHGHTLAAYHNLYDFAKDPEVKRLAKAALDWLYAAAAVKYWRGGFGGPNNRDYGGANVVLSGGAVQPLWLYFGDTVIENPGGHYDDVHHITSGYRPPPAVVELARKNFARPVELHATKPYYELWQPEQPVTPQYWETTYFGRTFQLGTARSREPMEAWTPSIFKMMAVNSRRGVDFVVINTGPLGEHSVKNPGDQIAQYRNQVLWLRPAERDPRSFYFQVPKTARRRLSGDVWFVELEKTWLAIRPIRLSPPMDYDLPQTAGKADQRTGQAKPNPRAALYADEQFFRAETSGPGYAGFALEVGEAPEHPTFEAFQEAVRTRGRLDTSRLAEGVVTLIGSDGRLVALHHNSDDDLPRIERDGRPWEYQAHLDVYQPEGQDAPIQEQWLSGTLLVEAGGTRFTCTVTRDGAVSWENFPSR